MIKLRQVRIAAGVSINRLSAQTGIAAPDISSIETGKRFAWPGWRDRISHALGVSAKELFSNTPSPPASEGPIPAEEKVAT